MVVVAALAQRLQVVDLEGLPFWRRDPLISTGDAEAAALPLVDQGEH